MQFLRLRRNSKLEQCSKCVQFSYSLYKWLCVVIRIYHECEGGIKKIPYPGSQIGIMKFVV